LDRIELASAFYLTVPGPKMIWQFGELGYDINIDFNGRIGNKPILWNYFDQQDRKDVYNTYAKLIALKLTYDIFETSDFTLDVANSNGLKKIHLSDAAATDIQYITIIGNFGITAQEIIPNFQQVGNWYSLLEENALLNVTNAANTITLQPGEFKVYANKAATLSTEELLINSPKIIIYPNIANDYFKVNTATHSVALFDLNGKKIKQFKGDFIEGHPFDITTLQTGLYIVQIQSNTATFIHKIMIE
jgi:hypothetical protein